jgi:dihydroorotase-like cyclic amidohydrolase
MKTRISTIVTIMILFIASSSLLAQKFEQPVCISSAGQSADVKLVKMLAQRQGLDATTVLMAKPEDLKGIKTLIIVPGFSSKGLGAAGISQQDEIERVQSLIKAANDLKIPIVLMHIGGNARRQGQSDAFNQLVAENSKHMLVVKQGDEDGFFSSIAKAKNIPLTLVEKIAETAEPLGNLFK